MTVIFRRLERSARVSRDTPALCLLPKVRVKRELLQYISDLTPPLSRHGVAVETLRHGGSPCAARRVAGSRTETFLTLISL